MKNKIILASKSVSRQAVLKNAGIDADIIPSNFDEDIVKQKHTDNPNAGNIIALDLAKKKALSVSKDNPDCYIIGADQTLSLDGKLYSKPKSVDGVKNHLQEFSGKTHTLHGGLAIAFNNEVIFSKSVECHMTVKKLSEEYIEWYGQTCGEAVQNSVGGYHFEGLGIQLFEKVDGDYFSILGLPIIPLVEFLQGQGIIKC